MSQVVTSLKALINYQGKFLFLHEKLHQGTVWDLPGGKIEFGEEVDTALKREIREEVNLNIEIIKSIGVWWFYSQQNKHQVICHTFLCELINNNNEIDFTQNPADEHFIGFQWLTIEEALNHQELKLASSLRKLLKQI